MFFGNRRRRRGEATEDAWVQQAVSMLPVDTFEELKQPDIPADFARLLRAESAQGSWLIAVSASGAVRALLAAVLAAGRLGADPARTVAAAPRWSAASLGLCDALAAVPVRPLILNGEQDARRFEPLPLVVSMERTGAQFKNPRTRQMFHAARAGFESLAARHGGAVRVADGGLELVIAARPLARLSAEDDRVQIESLHSRAETFLIDSDEPGKLDTALSRLGGDIPRHLKDRKVRNGEEGLRARMSVRLAEHIGLAEWRLWPAAGAASAIDVVGAGSDGAGVMIAVRMRLDLSALGEILEGALALEPVLGVVLEGVSAPVRIGAPPLLAISAHEFDASAHEVLEKIGLPLNLYKLSGSKGHFSELEVAGAPARRAAAGPAASAGAAPAHAGAGPAHARSPVQEAGAESAVPSGPGHARSEAGQGGRRRGRTRLAATRRRSAARSEAGEGGESAGSGDEEFSIFDLDDDEPHEARGASRRSSRNARRRGRRNRRGAAPLEGAQAAGENPAGREDAAHAAEDAAPEEGAAPENGAGAAAQGEAGQSAGRFAGPYTEGEAGQGSAQPGAEPSPEQEEDEYDDPALRERELRRSKRAEGTLKALEGDADDAPAAADMPRGRAAVLALAERDSIVAALLLARESRQLAGIWVYPQEELMTFFRNVATDLGRNTPIYVVGFSARPVREVVQAASLYKGRLMWFDHHDWPPEDIGALIDALGEAYVQVRPNTFNSLPAVVDHCKRRNRFSERLVDLVSGRFTRYDFERWGFTWWSRLGELAQRSGEMQAELELLLRGRTSDLANQAARAPKPARPEELDWAADCRVGLMHFGALALVSVELPTHLDLQLAVRALRERSGAALSLARYQGSELFMLGSAETGARRSLNLQTMAEHLEQKFLFVEALPAEDSVTCIRIRGLSEERLAEVIAEIGMSRSLLEG